MLDWFINHIAPYLTISLIGGAVMGYNKIQTLSHAVSQLRTEIADKHSRNHEHIGILEQQLSSDIDSLRKDIEYLTRNNVSRDELNTYLRQIDAIVVRVSDTLARLV